MYVLCTLVVLSIHSLFKSRHKALEPGDKEARDGATLPRDKTPPVGEGGRSRDLSLGGVVGPREKERGMTVALSQDKRQRAPAVDRKAAGCNFTDKQRGDGELRCSQGRLGCEEGSLENVPDSRKRLQPVQRPSALLSPAVMFSTRKTWDLGHAPCLQELWKKDVSLDASSVDFLMSDGEEDCAFLSLPAATFPQRTALTATDQLETSQHNHDQQLLIQTLQDKVCEFQARLRREEASRCLQLQRLQQSHEQSLQEKTNVIHTLQEELHTALPNGVRAVQRLGEPQDHQQHSNRHIQEGEQLIAALRTQVGELEEKLLDQTQEVERLRSELGATDLEKHLELLVVENERLKQELKACKTSLLQEAPPPACTATDCPHSQDAEALREAVSCWESQARPRQKRLAELEQQVLEKASMVETLSRQLEESKRHAGEMQRQLEESKCQQGEVEQQLSVRLRDCEEELARQAARPHQVKYVTEIVEVESSESQQAVAEAQAKSAALQEQLSLQRQLLRELETQLHDSQRTSTQLRAQILVYEGEMERAQGQLEAEMQNLEEEKNRVIEEAFIRAESEMKAVHDNLAGVRMNLLTLQPALRTLTCDYNCLKRQVQDFPFMLEKAITEAKQEICQVIGEVSSANQELLRKYKREMNLRKKCHNELVRMKGNIRVFCRVRPVCRGEHDSAENMVSFDPDDDALLYLSNKVKLMTFELDKVFHPQATQEEVFQEVQSLVTSCIDGFNVCIFAYGQTGSGKTYTMEGVAKDPGINQRALRLLFSEVTEKAPDWDFKITVSMVEIYNETLRNLLGDNQGEKLDIKMNPDGSGQLYVPGLTEFTVQSPEDINRVFELGHMNRATACTNLNEHSSRSHALLIITVAGVNSSTGHRTQGKLNLVDLAGSERIAKSGAEGSRLREAQCINKSLSALGDVINALRSRHSHVPFRNSRLTYLLSDSLSGDSKTLMMVQVSPLVSNMSESVCSLKFAQRVRTIELGNATRRQWENSSTSSSPTHDSVELDSPPVTPVPLPISRASSAGSTLSASSKTPTTRRRSQSQLSTDRLLGRASPLVGDGGQDD
ncbi:kinesin-like protein KIFC3 isoform X3 [Salmo salar]|uniref:Kinesin-like protein KIFC3 n=1 Tax=Salmo salar TaxID=8030 RepID=A0A1S3PRZ5_SALSA|nr:kinesin-like protein KIFC3 isoform X3 [Salmo salar]|eukprot:XP_014030458.1 PREDICTED: kinesin-like protein KIFC3 isoform X3 [Salmo salar]